MGLLSLAERETVVGKTVVGDSVEVIIVDAIVVVGSGVD